MRTRTVFEIVGTIVVLATLFSSVGLSGWNFSDNTILNPNLYDINEDGYPDYASGTYPQCNNDSVNDDWSFGYYSDNIVGINVSTYDRGATTAFITPNFRLNLSESQLIEFLYHYGNGTLIMGMFVSDGSSGDYCIDFNDVYIVETSASENPNFPLQFDNITVTDYSDGWKKFSGWTTFTPTYNFSQIQHYRMYFYGMDDLDYKLTNFSVMGYYYSEEVPAHTLDIALNYPDDTSMNDTNNIYFGYTPFSSDAIDNCSIYLNTSGAWQIHGTETNVTNGSVNNFLLANASNQTLMWGIECDNTYMTAFSENRTLAIAKAYPVIPCQGWECASTARSVVGLAPIIVGLGVLVGMIAMFLMKDEEESMLALVIKGGVIALIAVVMLTILVGVIG